MIEICLLLLIYEQLSSFLCLVIYFMDKMKNNEHFCHDFDRIHEQVCKRLYLDSYAMVM